MVASWGVTSDMHRRSGPLAKRQGGDRRVRSRRLEVLALPPVANPRVDPSSAIGRPSLAAAQKEHGQKFRRHFCCRLDATVARPSLDRNGRWRIRAHWRNSPGHKQPKDERRSSRCDEPVDPRRLQHGSHIRLQEVERTPLREPSVRLDEPGRCRPTIEFPAELRTNPARLRLTERSSRANWNIGIHIDPFHSKPKTSSSASSLVMLMNVPGP